MIPISNVPSIQNKILETEITEPLYPNLQTFEKDLEIEPSEQSIQLGKSTVVPNLKVNFSNLTTLIKLPSMYNMRSAKEDCTSGLIPKGTSIIGIGNTQANLTYRLLYDEQGDMSNIQAIFDDALIQRIQRNCRILSTLKLYLEEDMNSWPDEIHRFKRYRVNLIIKYEILYFVSDRCRLKACDLENLKFIDLKLLVPFLAFLKTIVFSVYL